MVYLGFVPTGQYNFLHHFTTNPLSLRDIQNAQIHTDQSIANVLYCLPITLICKKGDLIVLQIIQLVNHCKRITNALYILCVSFVKMLFAFVIADVYHTRFLL